ncbi:MAG: hypothetical protein QM645_05805 [Asticcacaulis sp.]
MRALSTRFMSQFLPQQRLRFVRRFMLTGLLAGTMASAAQADNLNLLTQRQFIHSANKTCNWLSGPEALALGGGLIQMRNAALMSGQSPQHIHTAINRARQAATRVDCHNPALLSEVDTVKGAYRGFVTQNRLNFHGPRASWLTDRTEAETQKWRLVQYHKTGNIRLAFGLYGHTDRHALSVMAQFPEAKRPYSARLMVRDPKYGPASLLSTAPLGLSTKHPVNLTRYDRSFPANGRHQMNVVLEDSPRVNLAGFNITGEYKGRPDPRPTVRFDFPIEATTALARLDPREEIIVVFEFTDGPQYARFEAGDFVPGLVFATLPSPYGR